MIKNHLARLCGLALLACVGQGCAATRAPDADGYQGVVELDEATLGFDLGGRLGAVPVARGDAVVEGQVLAQLDDTLAKGSRDVRAEEVDAAKAQVALVRAGARREDIASLQAQLRGAKATEAALEKEADRTRTLVAAGSVPTAVQDDVDARLSRTRAERESLEARVRGVVVGARPEELAVAEARVEAALAAVALEDQRLARHVLHAYAKGTVTDVHVKPGEVVGAGTPVITVGDPTHPYVDVFVAEGTLSGIRVGTKASMRVDAVVHPFDGTVEHVSNKTEFTPRYLFSDKERPNLVVRVRVRVDDPNAELHAGVPARVHVERDARAPLAGGGS